MIERDAGRLVISVPMIMANARGLLNAGRSVLQPGDQIIDLGRVGEADSSSVAVMLGWLRMAEGVGTKLRFANLPVGVRSLTELYGVAELLPLA